MLLGDDPRKATNVHTALIRRDKPDSDRQLDLTSVCIALSQPLSHSSLTMAAIIKLDDRVFVEPLLQQAIAMTTIRGRLMGKWSIWIRSGATRPDVDHPVDGADYRSRHLTRMCMGPQEQSKSSWATVLLVTAQIYRCPIRDELEVALSATVSQPKTPRIRWRLTVKASSAFAGLICVALFAPAAQAACKQGAYGIGSWRLRHHGPRQTHNRRALRRGIYAELELLA